MDATPGTAAIRYSNDTWPSSEAAEYRTIIMDAAHYSEAAAIKAASPGTRILGYALGVQATTGLNCLITLAAAQAHDAGNPGDLWLLKDSGGNYLLNGGRYLLNCGKASMRTQALTNARAILTANPDLDGLLLDNINATYTQLQANTTSLYTNATWETALVGYMSVVGAGLLSDGTYVLPNAGKAGSTFEAGYKGFWTSIAAYCTALLLEWFEQSPVSSPSPAADAPGPYPEYSENPAKWTGHYLSWLGAVAHAQSLGKHFYGGHYGANVSIADDQQKMMYGKAAFLLNWDGIDGGFFFVPSPRGTKSPLDEHWVADMGSPLGAMTTVGVGYRRDYANGIALVNPDPSSSQAFTLGGTFYTIEGDPVTTVTLDPVTAAIVLGAPPPPNVLFGARGGSATTSDLYTIDPATAVPTALGPIGYAVTGMAFDPDDGTLYGVTSNNSAVDPHSLITIDPVTGTGTLIGDLGDGTNNCSDIAFASDGTLYGWTTSTSELVTIDKATGVMTPVDGFTGEFAGGLSFVAAVLWHVTGSTTNTLDTSTGEETFVTNVFDGGQLQAASYGGGQMFISISSGGASRLKTIDDLSVDGGTTNIGTMFASGAPMDAIAWGLEVTPPPPPPPPPFSGRVYADLPVRIFATSITSRTLTVLDHRATGRQFMFVLNGPAYHTGQVASDDVEINRPFPDADSPALISNNVRLVYALQRWKSASPPYTCIFGGILMTPEDQGSDAPTTRYTASDPWQYMMSRPVRDPDSSELPGVDGLKFPPGSRASDIALALLQTTEIVEGETFIDFSDTDLIEDTVPLPAGIKFDEGTMVGEAWQQLCNTGTIDITLPPLYDPIGSPGKVTRFATAPRAGQVRYNAVMAWDKPGNSLMDISRLVDGTRMANRVQFFAGQGGVPVPLQSDAASITANGEYWAQQFFPGTHDRNMVELLALASVLIRRNGARSIALDPAPERTVIPFRDYGLGDYLPVWASRNLREPLGVDYDSFDPDFPGAAGYQRVYAIPFELDDNGVARVRGILTSQETAVGG